MSIVNYKSALLKTIQNYEEGKGKNLSRRRQIDIADLKQIIQMESNPAILRSTLLARVSKIKTGWWFFETGNSQLKKAVLKVMREPKYAVDKLNAEEAEQSWQTLMKRIAEEEKLQEQILVKLRSHMLDSLQKQAKKLNTLIEEQRIILQEQACQLHLQEQRLGGKLYHFTYVEYLINLLDKFIRKNVLSALETEQLLKLLEYKEHELEDMAGINYSNALIQKVADAYEFALDTLINGLDYLTYDNNFENNTFKCIAKYADSYCHMLNSNYEFHMHLQRKMNKLLLSYYQDGAGKTTISSLPVHHKSEVLETKETLVSLYGTASHSQAIAPLCELRMASRWEEFKKMCSEKSRIFYQWLKGKSHKNAQSIAENEINNASRIKTTFVP